MLKFKVNGKLGNKVLTLPTKLSEITPEYLTAITNHIAIGKYHSLIGICYREKLSNIIISSKQNKNLTTAVIPVFIKTGPRDVTDDSIANYLNTGDKLIISSSQISLGQHVSSPLNNLTIDTFLRYIDGYDEVYKHAITISDYVYFLEFKIIPNCDIKGSYSDINNSDFANPFAITDVKEDVVD